MKKLLVILLVLLLLAGGVAAFFFTRKPGSIEEWIGRQVVGIANSYLVPKLDYKTVKYSHPGEVTMTGVTLVAPDGTTVMDLGTFNIVLAEVPSIGQPIVMENLVIKNGSINLVKNPAGGFKGLSPITKVSPSSPKDQVPDQFKLSNVFKLKRIELADCSIRYDSGDGAPIVLDAITTGLDIVKDASGEPGWYALALNAGRAPAAVIDMKGRVNLDTYTVDIQQGNIQMRLDAATTQSLPGGLQSLVKAHDMSGNVQATLSGRVPLTDLAKGDATLNATIADFAFAAADYRLPVQNLTMSARLAGGTLDVSNLSGTTLSGQISALARMDMNSTSRPTSVRWQASNLDLSQMYRDPRAKDEPKKIIGMLTTSGSANLNASDWKQALSGTGTVELRNGRVFALPGFMDILGMFDKGLLGKIGAVNNHEVTAAFNLQPTGVNLTSSEIRTELMAARATGTVGFDKSLNLAVNAGPLERLQSALGRIGDIIGKVTDKLVTYRVRGTTDDPKVSLEPLGAG